MEAWMEEVDTDPNLLDCIAEYAYARGGRTMMEICDGLGERYLQMAREQDAIGWRRFMEGMIPATATSSLRAPGALPLTCIFNQTFPI